MKFPSFLRTPGHQRFHYEPRYYDPIKEDLKQRKSRIKKELENENEEENDHQSQLRGAFSGRIYKRKTASDSSVMLRFFIMAMLFGAFFGYIYLGETIFYLLLPFAALFIYLRIRRIF